MPEIEVDGVVRTEFEPVNREVPLGFQINHHHISIYKVNQWWMRCACGASYQSRYVELLWAHLPTFEHKKRGWADERFLRQDAP
jgi:hypothetical protein